MPCMRGNLNKKNPVDRWDSFQLILWSEWEKTNKKEAYGWQYCINISSPLETTLPASGYKSLSTTLPLAPFARQWPSKTISFHTPSKVALFSFSAHSAKCSKCPEKWKRLSLFSLISLRRKASCATWVKMYRWFWRSCLVCAGIWMPLELHLMSMWWIFWLFWLSVVTFTSEIEFAILSRESSLMYFICHQSQCSHHYLNALKPSLTMLSNPMISCVWLACGWKWSSRILLV